MMEEADNEIILVGENNRELRAVPNIQLVQNHPTPADVLFVTIATLQVLSCQMEVSVNV